MVSIRVWPSGAPSLREKAMEQGGASVWDEMGKEGIGRMLAIWSTPAKSEKASQGRGAQVGYWKLTRNLPWRRGKMSPSRPHSACNSSPTCCEPSTPYLTLRLTFPPIPIRWHNLPFFPSDSHPNPCLLHFFLSPWVTRPIQTFLGSERLKMDYLPKTLPPPPVLCPQRTAKWRKHQTQQTAERGGAAGLWFMIQQRWVRGSSGRGSHEATKRRRGINWIKLSSTLKILVWFVPEIGLSLWLVLTC